MTIKGIAARPESGLGTVGQSLSTDHGADLSRELQLGV